MGLFNYSRSRIDDYEPSRAIGGLGNPSGVAVTAPAVRSKRTEDPRNPDPSRWEIVKTESIGNYLIVKIRYPNCTNYEGNKILVFRGISAKTLVEQRLIDPHFFEGSNKYQSPLARFVPTEEGWEMAKKFVTAMG